MWYSFIFNNYQLSTSIIIRVFCPRVGPSLQAQEPRLQFCGRQVFHRKLRNQGCSFTMDCISAVASRCFPQPKLSLASEQTLKDLKNPRGTNATWRWGEWIWLTGPSELHRNSPERLNISFVIVLTRSEIRKSQSPLAPIH